MENPMKSQTLVNLHTQHGLMIPTELTDVEAFSKNHMLGLSPPETLYDAEEQALDVELQFSRLEQSMNAASLLDERGFWNGRQEDEVLRLELQEISLRLQKMLTHPFDTVQAIAQAHHMEASLRYAVQNNIAEYVPIDDAIAYNDLAFKASVNESQCRRILRLLMSQHIFAETANGDLCHTPASRQLLDPHVRAWVEYQTTDSLKSSTHLTEALEKWPNSSHKSETAYSLAHDTDLPMFDHLARDGKIERFRTAMSGMAQQPCFSNDHVLSGYSWQDIAVSREQEMDTESAPVVVDVGGGIGHVGLAVSDAFPSLDVRVQDIGVIETHSKSGVQFTRYDFFDAQPIKNADVYFMRQILHDWSDDYVVRILQNQIAAMGPHSKLLIMDEVLERPGEWTLCEERKSRIADITMLTLFNAKEREMHEWTDLVRKASDSRLGLTHLARPIGSLMSIMEFSFV